MNLDEIKEKIRERIEENKTLNYTILQKIEEFEYISDNNNSKYLESVTTERLTS